MGTWKVLVLCRLVDPVIADVQSALTDWAAAGLVDQPLWLDVEQEPAGQPHGWAMSTQGRASMPVANWLAEQGVKGLGAGVRIVCLQPLQAASDVVLVETVTQLCSRLPLPTISIVNILAPVPDLIDLPNGVVFDNHRNILLQPIASESPDGAAVMVGPGRDYSLHVAAGLVTLGGLWSTVDEAPNDSDPVLPSQLVQTARTYLRYLDGSEILRGLAFNVLQDNDGLPCTRSPQGQRYPPVGKNVTGSVSQAAAELVGQHPVAGYRPKPPPVLPPKTRISPMTAIRDFLSFLGAAVLSAPGDWVRRQVDNVTSRIGTTLTKALFGKDGAYEVVMGRVPGRSPDAVAARDGALELLRLMNVGDEPPAVSADQLWMAEVGVIADLADGGIGSKIALPVRGDQRLIISEPGVIAPAPGGAPFVVPAGILASQIPVTVSVDDPFTAYQVLEELQDQRQWLGSWQGPGDPGVGAGPLGGPPASSPGSGNPLVAGQTADALKSWMSERTNFAWFVSETIGRNLHNAQLDQSEMLKAAGEEEIRAATRDAEREARKTRRRLLMWLLALVVAVIAVVALAVLAIVPGLLVGVIAVVLGLGWLIGAMATFINSSRKYYQLMHALDVLSARRQWAEKLRFEIPADIVRLSDVYSRSRQWAQVIGDLVHDPFCLSSLPDIGEGTQGRLAGLLPQGLALGSLPFDEESYQAEMTRAAQLALQPGWLGEAESQRRSLALRALSGQYGTKVDEHVWDSDGRDRGSPLQVLMTAGQQPEFRRERALQALTWFAERIGVAELPLKQATIEAGGNLRMVDANTFMQALIDAEPTPQQAGVASRGLQNGVTETKFTHLWGVTSTTTSTTVTDRAGNTRTVTKHATARPAGMHRLDRLVIRCDLSEQSWPGNFRYFADATEDDLSASPSPNNDDDDQPPLPAG